MVRTCEVALPLPLRTTFTYRIPEALDESIAVGARVVVPFRNRTMLGVVVGFGDSPDGGSLKDIAEILDPVPALSTCLVELGRWISNYYLCPIGETFRAMLPPTVEMQFEREWQITELGRARLRELQPLISPDETESADLAVLEGLEKRGGVASDGTVRKLLSGSPVTSRLLRKNELVMRGTGRHRVTRMQKI